MPSTLTYLAALRLEIIRNEILTDQVRKKAVLCLIDFLGALVSGIQMPWTPAVLEFARVSSLAGVQNANVMGLESSVSAEVAAFTNSTIAHSIIRDDMHLGAGSHIGVMVIPAAMALAQRDRWTGEEFLKSIVGAYEMAASLGVSVRHSGCCNPHFRPSGIVGAFGAVGAGITVDKSLTTATATNALGFAANMAAGLNEWPWGRGIEMTTHMGTASRGGITSLDLARAGLSCSSTVLEGKDGLFMAYGCGDQAADKFREWLETSPLGTGITGARFKPFAGCNFVQTPVAAALSLHDQVKDQLDCIETILIVTTRAARDYPGCNSRGPFQTVQQTKMSIQYAVSAALLFGQMDEASYWQFDNPILTRLCQLCMLDTDQIYDKALMGGRQPCRVQILLTDGTTHDYVLKDVPWLDGPAVEERFRRETASWFGTERVDQIIRECYQLNANESCEALFHLIISAPVPSAVTTLSKSALNKKCSI